MNRKIVVFILLALSAVLFFLSNKEEKASKEDVLIVGTNAEYVPYTFIENRKIVGFDIDIAEEICQKLGKKMEIRDVPFDALIAELVLGKIDLIAAGMTKTEERAKRVFFTEPYHCDDYLVVVSKEGSSLEELKGKTVVVNEGYTADIFASDLQGITLIRLSAPADAFLALTSGRADAFITAKSTAENFENNTFSVAPIEHTTEGVSLVLAKDNTLLQEEVEKILQELIQSGKMAQLKEKWGLE